MMNNKFDISMDNGPPLLGLERIATELQQERQKCTAALKDRARQKIEIEKLKQKNLMYQQELTELKERLSEIEKYAHDESLELNETAQMVSDREKELNQCRYELQAALKDAKKYKDAVDELNKSNSTQNSQLLGAREQLDEAYEQIATQEKVISELKDSNALLKQLKSDADGSVAAMTSKYNEQLKELEEYKLKSRKIHTVLEKYNSLQENGEEMRGELEDALRRNTSLTQEVREYAELARIKENLAQQLEHELEEANSRIETLQDEMKDIQSVHKELNMQIESQKRVLTAEQERNEASRSARQYLDAQINELRDAHANALRQCANAESELAAAFTKISALSSEVDSLREQASLVEGAQRDAESARTLAVEVESLRSELREVRKQLVKREVEEEANSAVIGESFTGKSIAERDRNSRKVFEGIIEDLRASLDKAINEQYNLTHQLELANKRASRVEHLEEELAAYKDTVRLVAVENQSAAISASEAIERTQKTEHDNQMLTMSIRNLENENRVIQGENKRLKDELTEEKKKHRGVHVDKLGVERKISELSAEKNRLETDIADLKREVDRREYEFNRSERLLKECRDEISSLKEQLSLAQVEGDSAIKKYNEAILHLNINKQRVVDADGEIRALRETRATLQREVDMLHEVSATHRRSAAESSLQIDALRREIAELQNSNDSARQSVAHRENVNAEQQIQMLRADLLKTVGDWKEAERDRQIKEDTSKRLQNELLKERDKSQLLQNQVSKLEDRLIVANRELAAFRGLDVYHAAKEAELATYRTLRGVQFSYGGNASQRQTSDFQVETVLKSPDPNRLMTNESSADPWTNQQPKKQDYDFSSRDRNENLRNDALTYFDPTTPSERAPTSPLKGEPLNIDDISTSTATYSKSDKLLNKVLPRKPSYLDDDTDDSDAHAEQPVNNRLKWGSSEFAQRNKTPNLVDNENESRQKIYNKPHSTNRKLEKDQQIAYVSSDEVITGKQQSTSELVVSNNSKLYSKPRQNRDEENNRRHPSRDSDEDDSEISRDSRKAFSSSEYVPYVSAKGDNRSSNKDNFVDSVNNTRKLRDSASDDRVYRYEEGSKTMNNGFKAPFRESTKGPMSSTPKTIEKVRPHRDMTYNPSKADFEKARQLLARTGKINKL